MTVSQCTITDQEPTTIQWSINLRTRSAWGHCQCPLSTAAACPAALRAETEMGLEGPAEPEVRPTASEASRPTRGLCIPPMCIWATWTHPDQCRQSVIFPEMNSVMEVEGLRDAGLCLINKWVNFQGFFDREQKVIWSIKRPFKGRCPLARQAEIFGNQIIVPIMDLICLLIRIC